MLVTLAAALSFAFESIANAYCNSADSKQRYWPGHDGTNRVSYLVAGPVGFRSTSAFLCTLAARDKTGALSSPSQYSPNVRIISTSWSRATGIVKKELTPSTRAKLLSLVRS